MTSAQTIGYPEICFKGGFKGMGYVYTCIYFMMIV